MDELLRIEDVSKTFPGVKALDGVSFNLYSGEIHCLCGENGAGKSTLIKVISGAYQPDRDNCIFFEGNPEIMDPLHALKLGVRTVYQEDSSYLTLNIIENIFAGAEIARRGIVNKKAMYEKTAETLRYLHSDLDPNRIAGTLTIPERKLIEIAKAIVFNNKILILDEPMASFSASEIEEMLEILRKLKANGMGIIYISHHLEEVFKIADRITVLRDGKSVLTCDATDITQDELIRNMVGRDAPSFYHREYFERGEPSLKVEGFTGNGVYDISFEAHRGEILGFAGMVGSGRSELMDLLFGAVKKDSGKMILFGEEIELKSPKDAIKNKMCYITENRQHTGLFMAHTVARNTYIPNLVNKKSFYLKPSEEFKTGEKYVRLLDIKTPSIKRLVLYLSGGNQQKVVLAKWFNTEGEIFIFDEPTRGIDVGAKQEIYKIMTDLIAAGKSIIMVSSDMPEIVSMSDRVLVMRDGRICGEIEKENLSEEVILQYSIGG